MFHWFKDIRRSSRSEVGAIIFSKDRPMQLASLLESMRHYCQNIGATHIIYAVSHERYAAAYANLEKKFVDVVFHCERSFRADLIALLRSLNHRLVFFLVDDLIFTDSFDASTLSQIDARKYILSLRLHPGITYSYMTHRQQQPPPFKPFGSELLSFSWRNDSVDWAYPLSVDGHVFERKTMLRLINKCQFRAPNSLEASLQVYAKEFFARFHGLCYGIPKIVNFPVNRVQAEFENRAGEKTAEEFLDLFNNGYEIDFSHYDKCTYNSVHVNAELALRKR